MLLSDFPTMMSNKETATTTSIPSETDVEVAIIALLAEVQEREAPEVRETLAEAGADMPIDSLEGVEIILGLEERFGIHFPDDKETSEALRSVKTLVERVRELAGEAST
jgi:acyl carrier protein